MVYDFQNHQNAPELTLHATHTYIWSLAPRLAKYLCWADVFTESEQEKVLSWITLLDPDQYLDALRASLLVFSVSDGRVAVEWRFGFMPIRTSTGYRLPASRCRRRFLAT